MSDFAITTDQLVKTYTSAFGRKQIHALKGVDLQIEHGEIVGILGPNGAGKTTLLKILLGIVAATSGSGTILGKPMGNVEARARLGYLPENHRFPPYLTARQTLDIYGRLSGMDDASIKKRIPLLIEEAGLSSWIDTRVGKYSKGMMQRLGLAQATLNDPDILVLDEPTDGVDPIGRREIRDRLRVLKSRGKTILINSHLLTEIELVCDRVAILNHGEIVRAGSIDEISGAGSGWRIECSSLPNGLDLTPFGAEPDDDGAESVLLLPSGPVQNLNGLIDHLRQNGIQIVSIERHRRSLEAGFLDIIDREESS